MRQRLPLYESAADYTVDTLNKNVEVPEEICQYLRNSENLAKININIISKSKMISRRQGGGDEAYFTYVEEADDDVNKDSALI